MMRGPARWFGVGLMCRVSQVMNHALRMTFFLPELQGISGLQTCRSGALGPNGRRSIRVDEPEPGHSTPFNRPAPHSLNWRCMSLSSAPMESDVASGERSVSGEALASRPSRPFHPARFRYGAEPCPAGALRPQSPSCFEPAAPMCIANAYGS